MIIKALTFIEYIQNTDTVLIMRLSRCYQFIYKMLHDTGSLTILEHTKRKISTKRRTFYVANAKISSVALILCRHTHSLGTIAKIYFESKINQKNEICTEKNDQHK